MKDYLKEAIESGKAVDVYVHPDEVKQYIEDKIGYTRDVFTDIDNVINILMAGFRKEGVMYWGDIDATLYNWQSRNLSKYMRLLVEGFKQTLADEIKKVKK